MTAKFVCRLTKDFEKPPLPAIALTTDTFFLTAFTNDYGYEDVFARPVTALGQVDDILLHISISGSSVSVVRAVEQAQAKALKDILEEMIVALQVAASVA